MGNLDKRAAVMSGIFAKGERELRSAVELAGFIKQAHRQKKIPVIVTDEPELIRAVAKSIGVEGGNVNMRSLSLASILEAMRATLAEGADPGVVICHRKHKVGAFPEPFVRAAADRIFITLGSIADVMISH
ncbi:hypothetical protein vBSlqSZDD2_43 [Serratia phage vB_SlqS_ZDD2]|nr:hypothetical protein vBSlqSZDD2_43 [Serratia phage vB_SlqS_ZDD2]